MKVYLSAQFHRQAEMRQYREDLRSVGWNVVSSWIDTEAVGGGPNHMGDVSHAIQDIEDMDQADGIILFTGPPYYGSLEAIARGSRHVEFGMMSGLPSSPSGKVLIVIGEYENVFQKLPEVAQFPSWEAFKNYITL